MNRRDAKALAIRDSWRKHHPGREETDQSPEGNQTIHRLVHGGGEEVRPADARGLLQGRLALPVREVAKLLGISSAAVRLMIHRGDLPGKKVGGGSERITYIIPTGPLLAWLDGLTTVPSGALA
jgi:excisionase family DNA binding protein